jgi:hypothetical protein
MPLEGARPVAMGETAMRISSTLLALGLASLLAGLPASATAQSKPKYDFPKPTFDGGNHGRAGWRIQLKRSGPGQVVFDLASPRGVRAAHGTLTSVKPEPGPLELTAQYALSGEQSIAGERQALLVMLTPSPKDKPCQDTRRKKYSQAILVFIGDIEDGGRLLFGCGEFAKD